ncbi:uncharacterized protein G2W53_029152 [Senna tora]|uniref:Uncharacterized protein n=1 Tax=Senna tora TaxID=362788 RepID=A0A834T2D3_9FABA|nr:uncharacterized protein G2W53_029152 [Senna tora]
MAEEVPDWAICPMLGIIDEVED